MKIINNIILVLIILTFTFSCNFRGNQGNEDLIEEEFEPHLYGFLPDTLKKVEGQVKQGHFFSVLMGKLGLEHYESHALTEACDSVFDLKSIRVGNYYEAYYPIADSLNNADTTKPLYFVYKQDKINYLVLDCRPPYRAYIVSKPVTLEKKIADVEINTSLWNDMIAEGVSPLLIVSLSDIYAWTVDFFGLQKGDRFQVMYEQSVCDEEVIAIDTIRYAVFMSGKDTIPAIMFDQGDGGNIYWNEKGESMRKAFLKAPLKFSRVSSGFSYSRKHPVTGKRRPHTGVDYAAPTGTPVFSIGDGKVVSAGYGTCGAHGGHAVKIRHNSVYTTAYLHLSRYASGVRAGTRVRQGQVIGYVGSTGQSTGPHLDFRVWQNGSPINPLKMKSPPAEPLKQEFKPAFDSLAVRLKNQLDSALLASNASDTSYAFTLEAPLLNQGDN